MDLSLLAEFETVARKSSFRAAAKELHLSASALSSHIKTLESDLGAVLFERTTRTVTLTPAGRALLEETRGSIGQLERTADLVRRIHEGQVERLRIGHGDSAAVELLARAVANLLDQQPGVRLSIEEHPSTALIDRLVNRELDLALLRPPLHHADLNEELLFEEPFVALVPDRHPLAHLSRVSLEHIARYPLIVPPRTMATAAHDIVLDACRNVTGKLPAIGQEAADPASFLILVSAGAGVALLPRYTTNHLRLTGLKTLTLTDDLPRLPLHVAWRRDNIQPLLLTLRTNLQKEGRRLQRRKN